MATHSKQYFIALSIENKYLQEGIKNSYAAEKSGISLAEFYDLKENQVNQIKFRKKILQFLDQTPNKK